MAFLKTEIDFNFKPIYDLAKIFPEINGRLLALVGKRSRILLREKYLSGQELTLKPGPVGKSGKLLITSDVNRRRDQVKIYSFPLNLFEKGRMLRSGRKEAGKFILTRKLKADVNSRMSSYVREFENKILQPEIDKVGL